MSDVFETHCIALYCIALECIALECTALECTALECTAGRPAHQPPRQPLLDRYLIAELPGGAGA